MNGVPMKLDYSKTINEQLPTFEYYKNRYAYYELEIMQKRKELDQYKNNWEELKKWLKEEYDYYDKYGSAPTGCAMGEIKRTLNKMKELEEDK